MLHHHSIKQAGHLPDLLYGTSTVPQDPKSDILHYCCHNDTIATNSFL